MEKAASKRQASQARKLACPFLLSAVPPHSLQKHAVSQKTIMVTVGNINQRANSLTCWPSAGSSCTHWFWTQYEAFCKWPFCGKGTLSRPTPAWTQFSNVFPFRFLSYCGSACPPLLTTNNHCPINILSEHVYYKYSWFSNESPCKSPQTGSMGLLQVTKVATGPALRSSVRL